jgi:heme O synthase-like polyprenyltransferase
MELVIIVSTITAFFSHFLIEKGIVANSVSVIVATLMTWLLVRMQADNPTAVSITDISIAALTALVISLIVGVVFAQHKKCSK